MRGPGRVPVGIGPRRCSKGRFAGELPVPPGPPDLGVYGRPCPPGCIGRIGCPGRGPPVRCPLPDVVPGTGPRFPVGNGRAAALGRAPGAPGAAAAGRTEDCAPAGTAGRSAAAPVVGCPPVAGGRIGVGAGGLVDGVAGATGFAAGGATACVIAGVGVGAFGTTGATAGATDAGAAGGAGATGLAAGGAAGDTVGATCTALGSAGFAATLDAAATGATGAVGRILAALVAASFASLSALAAASAAASVSAWPKIFLRTFSATSSGIELECVFFSVTPYPGKRSMIAFAFTSSSRANSLIRT